jgi:hypothetical protein
MAIPVAFDDDTEYVVDAVMDSRMLMLSSRACVHGEKRSNRV